MSEILDLIFATGGIMFIFGLIGFSCAVWEITLNIFKNRRRKKRMKQVEKPKEKYIKWNN